MTSKKIKPTIKKKTQSAVAEFYPKSVKKSLLQWLVLAKRPETLQKRITEIASKAGIKQKPAHIQ